MERYNPTYFGDDQQAAEQFRRLAEILPGFRPRFISPTLLNSWIPYDSGDHSQPGYYKDPYDRVFLRGVVKDGTAPGIIFILPEGYRPASGGLRFPTLAFNGATLNAAVLGINSPGTSDGEVELFTSDNDFVYLDGISFLAEQ